MDSLDEIIGIKNSREHISHISDLIGTTLRNRRLLLKSELLKVLDTPKSQLVERLYQLDPADFGVARPFLGVEEPSNVSVFKVIKRTLPNLQGKRVPDLQFVPEQAYEAYVKMKARLIADISGRVVLSSAYRSPAFQVLIFCYNLKRYEFNLKKTLSLVSLPGYSEHGLIETCALDLQLSHENFLRPDRVKYYARSAEFKWLQANADSFGFRLSFPKNSKLGMAFEPWHWRYLPKID